MMMYLARIAHSFSIHNGDLVDSITLESNTMASSINDSLRQFYSRQATHRARVLRENNLFPSKLAHPHQSLARSK